MIVFIDTEVDPQTKKVADYGAVREDGAVLHSHSKADFDAFVSKCDTICGHNIINHDLKYTALRGNPTIIVNAANSQMLGCFYPLHKCIDNAIHSAAGVQLREECHRIMLQQGHEEPTGQAKITKAYNLPCKHVIHTVGPIIPSGIPTPKQKEQLASCYRSIMQLAVENRLESVAFCCISTGEFHFPNGLAAEIAVKTVKDFLDEHPGRSVKQVVFNVFKDVDRQIYESISRPLSTLRRKKTSASSRIAWPSCMYNT